MLARVSPVFRKQGVADQYDGFCLRAVAKGSDSSDNIEGKMKAVELVQHSHFEGRGRRPFFTVSVNVEVTVIGAAIC